MYVHMYAGTIGGQSKYQIPLELKLEVVVSLQVWVQGEAMGKKHF